MTIRTPQDSIGQISVSTITLKKNVLANYLGQGWRVIMSLAFVPLYIKYLGIEAYGLIGIFAMLQASLSLLDIGMKPTLGREMARFTGGAHNIQSIWNLLRSIEIISICIAVLLAFCIWVVSDWLATDWVQVENLPIELVAKVFAIMGVVAALQFLESIYTSAIVGLQRQVIHNVVASLMVTVRSLGAVGTLVWISPTISAFFLWQGLISLVTVSFFAGVVYRVLPLPPRPAHFSMDALIGIWRYAAGMVGITTLGILLTQTDKLLLSRLLSLESFGYYALASVVAGSLYMLTGPVTTAFFPRFTELLTKRDEIALRKSYHQAAQLVTVLMGSAGIILMVNADKLLQFWTGDVHLTEQVAPLVIVLALGTLLNGLMWIPTQMQLAHGWTSLGVIINSIFVIVFIPAILWIVPQYEAIGAAWIWVTLNAGYVFIGIHFMYRRILCNEKWLWYFVDILFPLIVASVIALACRWIMPEQLGRIGGIFAVLMSFLVVVVATCLSAPLIRKQLTYSLSCFFHHD